MKQLTIYSTPVCPYCKRAKAFLENEKIAYQEVDLSADEKLRDELTQKYDWQTVPMIFIEEEFIGGYDDLMNLYAEGKLLEKIGG